MEAVALNEAARVVMSKRTDLRPNFALTPEQEAAFANYGPQEAVKATVAARILSGDPSALIPTAEQTAFVKRLAREMGIAEAAPTASGSGQREGVV
jgi:pyruvate/2-oxoglutarate dehydrogenase complex dihydrolipoamide acyltransferase (E2) component